MTSTSASDELKAQLKHRCMDTLVHVRMAPIADWQIDELVDYIVDECLSYEEQDTGCCYIDGWVYKETEEEAQLRRTKERIEQEIADEKREAERREMLAEACRDAGIDPKVLP